MIGRVWFRVKYSTTKDSSIRSDGGLTLFMVANLRYYYSTDEINLFRDSSTTFYDEERTDGYNFFQHWL